MSTKNLLCLEGAPFTTLFVTLSLSPHCSNSDVVYLCSEKPEVSVSPTTTDEERTKRAIVFGCAAPAAAPSNVKAWKMKTPPAAAAAREDLMERQINW